MSDRLCIYHVDFNFVNLRPDYIRQWLRRIAAMGYNAVLWEPEDKVAWDACRQVIWPEALSKDDFRAILDEANRLGLESIPLLQTVGHGEYVLKHPAFHHLRELPEHHDCYCTENPATREFLKQLIGEYLDVFGPVRHFHLGGDEAYVFARCPICLPRAEAEGRNALYSRHIQDLCGPIEARGARPGIWCDMVLHHPEQMDLIPRSLAMWDWNYWSTDGPQDRVRVWDQGMQTREQITAATRERFSEIEDPHGALNGFYTSEALERLGYDVIVCSAARSAGDSFFCPRTHVHARNIAGAARKAARAGLLGTCVTDWAVRLNAWELHASYLPVAPALLKSPDAPIEPLLAAAAAELFGCEADAFIAAVDQLSAPSLPFGQAQSTGVQWNRLKDSVPAPPGYLAGLLSEWEANGTLTRERDAIDRTIAEIADGVAGLESFVPHATAGLETLHWWSRAAHLQLWQARLAREILHGRRSPGNAALLRRLQQEFEQLLLFDQTPASARQNAALVYDPLVEYMDGDAARGG